LNLDTLIRSNLVNLTQTPPGCANPPDLNNTVLIDTGANITLLQTGAPATRAPIQTATKSVTQPKRSLSTTENLLLLLNKLPVQARIAHHAPGISNNLLAASELVHVGCELFFHSTCCEITYNGEIILRGW